MHDKLKMELLNKTPVLKPLTALKETIWINPSKIPAQVAFKNSEIIPEDIDNACERLNRFAPYIMTVFPETAKSRGIIESPLVKADKVMEFLRNDSGVEIPGKLLIKCDSQLPISGSIKARGGIYEVLVHAENLAFENGKLSMNDDYSILSSEEFQKFFSNYELSVGSTGNLGLSIGIMGSKLGFRTSVHMSADARQWKKDLLRSIGVKVYEYNGTYSQAVEEGRKNQGNNCYFVDDENSRTLFLGYSVAASRLKQQLTDMNITVDSSHPLCVYLPCGVGGGPGGIAYGLKRFYGDAVHCFFAEPTHSPCMILGLATGLYDKVCVQDFGIDNITCADGLAVERASSFVGKVIEPFLSGAYTVSDNRLFYLLRNLADCENIQLEPSAAAGLFGPEILFSTVEGREYLNNTVTGDWKSITHIAWATGGSMVPTENMQEYYNIGKNIIREHLVHK